jgi:hypothetical protein
VNGYLTQNAFTIAPEAPNGGGPGDTDFGNSSVGIRARALASTTSIWRSSGFSR